MRRNGFLGSALGAAAALVMTGAALAQGQTPAEARDNRLDRLEKQLREVRDIVLQARSTGAPVEIKEAGPDPQVTALASRLDDMDQTLRQFTGQIETLQHDLASARRDAADAKAGNADLAGRLDKLEKQLAAQAPAPPPPPGGGQAGGPGDAPSPGDAKTAYAHARQILLAGDYPSASAAFQDYVDRFGSTPEAVPARYWIGETKYIQEDYAGAAAAYAGAIRGWPQTAWAPDAVVKLALSLVKLNRPKDACGALAELGRRYPRAPAAAKARADAARQKAGCAQ